MNKLLNRYFAKKVTENITRNYTLGLYIDKKIKREKGKYTLFVKRKDQKEENYHSVISVYDNEWMSDFKSFVLETNTGLMEYIIQKIDK